MWEISVNKETVNVTLPFVPQRWPWGPGGKGGPPRKQTQGPSLAGLWERLMQFLSCGKQCTGGQWWQALFWAGVLWDSSCFFVMRLRVVFTCGGAVCAFCGSMSMFWTTSGTWGMLGCGKAKEVALDDNSWAAVSSAILLLLLSRRVVVLF